MESKQTTSEPVPEMAVAITALGELLMKVTDRVADMEQQHNQRNLQQQNQQQQQREQLEKMEGFIQELLNRMKMDEQSEDSRPPEPRRQSVAVGRRSEGHPGVKEVQQAVMPNVLFVQQKVPDELITNVISAPAARKTDRSVIAFLRETDQVQAWIRFLHKELVVRKILVNEQKLGTAMGEVLTEEMMYRMSDGAVKEMFMRCLRTNQMTDRDGFGDVITTLTYQLKSKTPGWTFGVDGYDDEIYPQVVRMEKDIGDSIRDLMLGALPHEMESWPHWNWGSSEQPGGLRQLCLLFGPFRLNFEALMTAKKLKELDSVEGFLALLHSVNGFMCDEARRLKKSLAAATPVKSIREMQEAMAKIPQYTRVLARPAPQHAPGPLTPQHRTQPSPQQYSAPRQAYSSDPGRFRPHQTNLSQTNSSGPFRPAQREYARQAMLTVERDEDVFVLPDDSLLSDDYRLRYDDDPRRVVPEPRDLLNETIEYDEDGEVIERASLEAILGRAGGGPAPDSRTLYDPKQPNSKKPCFKHFYTGCPGDCGWSHSAEEMLKLRDQLWEKLTTATQWVKPEWIQAEAAKLRSRPVQEPRGYNARNPNLSCIIEGQATVTSRDDFARDQTNSSNSDEFVRTNSSSQSHNASSVFPGSS